MSDAEIVLVFTVIARVVIIVWAIMVLPVAISLVRFLWRDFRIARLMRKEARRG